MNPEDDLKSLWNKAKAQGLTLEKAAGLLEKRWLGKWGVSTVRDAVQGRGKEARENQLRVTLKEFLGEAESANQGRADSVKPPVVMRDDPPEYITVAECKMRIKQLEAEVARLRRGVLALSSAPPGEDADAGLIDAAADAPGGPAKS